LFDEIKGFFIPRLSEVFVKSYRKKESEAAFQVNKAFRFSEDMDDLDKNTCFSALYGEISLDVISLKLLVQNPFVNGRDLVLKSELAEYLNKDRHAFLKKLPSDFFDLRNQYGRAAYRMVYALYQRRQENHINLDMQTLEILKAGVDISFYGASANNLRWLKDKSKELEHIIKVKNKGLWGKFGEPLMYGCLIYIVVFAVIFFVMNSMGDDKQSSRNNSNVGGLVMDSVIDDEYWSKCMLGCFETVNNNKNYRRELLFDENGKGLASWEFKGDNSCRVSSIFSWNVMKLGNNQNSRLLLTYKLNADSCLLENDEIAFSSTEELPIAINWFQHPEGFKFGKTEFILKQIDTSYLTQYPRASENLRLKIKRMDYLQNLQDKILPSDYINEKLYSVVAERDYSILYLNRKSSMSRSKIATIKDIEKKPYLSFFEYGTEMPQGAVYLDFKNIRYENRVGEIVFGDARVFKTANRKVVLLEE